MPTIEFNNPVSYFPGNVPAPNIQVTVYDVDQGGDGDDVIYSGTTTDDGRLVGTSKNWSDRNTVKVQVPFLGAHTVNVPDVPAFMIRFKDGTNDSGRLPFIPAAGIPLILPWPGGGGGGGAEPIQILPTFSINGRKFANPYELMLAYFDMLENGEKRIALRVHSPEVDDFKNLLGDTTNIRKFVLSNLPAPLRVCIDPAESAQVKLLI